MPAPTRRIPPLLRRFPYVDFAPTRWTNVTFDYFTRRGWLELQTVVAAQVTFRSVLVSDQLLARLRLHSFRRDSRAKYGNTSNGYPNIPKHPTARNSSAGNLSVVHDLLRCVDETKALPPADWVRLVLVAARWH